jgi:hypothetical protein
MFSSLFLGENLTLVQWVGVILTLSSIYLVSVRSTNSSDISQNMPETQKMLESANETIGLDHK